MEIHAPRVQLTYKEDACTCLEKLISITHRDAQRYQKAEAKARAVSIRTTSFPWLYRTRSSSSVRAAQHALLGLQDTQAIASYL